MKKLVLALLLAVPYFICGSEGPKFELEDRDDYKNITFEISKTVYGERKLFCSKNPYYWSSRIQIEDPLNMHFYVGADKKYSCMGFIHQNELDITASLFHTNSGQLIKKIELDASGGQKSSRDEDGDRKTISEEEINKQIKATRFTLLHFFHNEFFGPDIPSETPFFTARSVFTVAHKLACKCHGLEYEEADMDELVQILTIIYD